MYKKFRKMVIISISICFILSGCNWSNISSLPEKAKECVSSFVEYVDLKYKEMAATTPTAIAKQQATEILNNIELREIKNIKVLMKPSIQKMENIDEEIERLFGFIDGEIISYDEPSGGKQSGKIRDYKTVYQIIEGNIYNIKTDAGKVYKLTCRAVKVDDKNPDDLGVFYINIIDKNLFTEENGYPEEGKVEIGYK